MQEERGAVEIFVALALVAILGITALVVDIGNAKQSRRNFQSAADSGALAGAEKLAGLASTATAVTFAQQYAFDSMNQPRGTGCSTSSGAACASSGGATVYVTTDTNQVHVKVCQTLQTSFARVLGIDTTTVCNDATARRFSTGGLPCAICVLNPSAADALWLAGGNAALNVSGGNVVVDSTNNEAMRLGDSKCHGSAHVIVTGGGSIEIAGGYNKCNAGYMTPDPPVQGSVPDPLLGIPTPVDLGITPAAMTTFPAQSVKSGTKTLDPGFYPSLAISRGGSITTKPGNYIIQGNVTLTGSGTMTLGAGIYVIEGAFTVDNGTTLKGDGVTLYFTCGGSSGYPQQTTDPFHSSCPSGGGLGGYFSQVGGGGTILTAPTSGTYQGLLIFYDRYDWGPFNPNQKTCDTYFADNGSTAGLQTRGTIYAKSAQLCLSGDATALDSLFVADRLYLDNGASITDTVIAGYQVPLSSASSVFLIG